MAGASAERTIFSAFRGGHVCRTAYAGVASLAREMAGNGLSGREENLAAREPLAGCGYGRPVHVAPMIDPGD